MENLKFPKTSNRETFEGKLIIDVLSAIKNGTITKALSKNIFDFIKARNDSMTDEDILNWYLKSWLEFLQLNGGIEEIKEKL